MTDQSRLEDVEIQVSLFLGVTVLPQVWDLTFHSAILMLR